MMATHQKSPLVRRAIKLEGLQRWVIGGLGFGGMIGGCVAVFTRTVEAGPVAMLGIGALFFLIGLSGTLPTRLKIGDNEAEWLEEVGEKVAAVADLVPPQAKANLAEALGRLAILSPRAASPAIAAIAYEELVIGMLKATLERLNAERPGAPPLSLEVGGGPYDRGFDAVIRDGARAAIGIEMKATSAPVSRAAVHQLIGQANAAQASAMRFLLVTRMPLTNSGKKAIEDAGNAFDQVTVADVTDLEQLTGTVRRLL